MAEQPIYFVIPRPVEIPRQKGIHATNGPNKCLIQYKGTKPERDKIQRAADALGISYGCFMRRVVNDVADQVIAVIEGREETLYKLPQTTPK